MDAPERWGEAAELLRRAGAAPRALRDWLGPAWAGPAARAFERWAEEFDSAVRRAATELVGLAASAAEGGTPSGQLGQRLTEGLGGLRRQMCGLAEVRVPSTPCGSADARREPVGLEHDTEKANTERAGRGRGGAGRDAEDAGRDAGAAAGTRQPGGTENGMDGHVESGVRGWVTEAVGILLEHGYRADQLNPDDIQTIIRYESSGNPTAVNRWDVNAENGTPSTGLMQTIQPTFDRYHLPGHDNILDPVDNIIAGVRYAVDRYGSVSRTPGIVSLRSGGGYRGY